MAIFGEPSRISWRRALRIFALILILSGVWVSLLHAAQRESRTSSQIPSPALKLNSDSRPSSRADNGPLPSFHKIVGGKFIENRESHQFIYTVDPILQASVEELFRTLRPPYSAFVALEPRTGKVLALVDYSRDPSANGGIWRKATYPAASVFKIITAACALEKGALHTDSFVTFRGNQYRMGPAKINKPSKWDRQTQFDEALGKSNNVVFGRIASQLVGTPTLRKYSEAFGFNQPLPFDFPVEISRANIPEGTYELARCGAGFGEVTLNPLHGALIAACIANQGIMMRPYLIETIRDAEGEVLYGAQPAAWMNPITSKTAGDLSRMMRRTVEDGTASKIFQRYGQELLKKMVVSGKTGSLSGENPPGLYDWFVGFAPADVPQIAFSAMAINYQRYKLRGAFVAQEALKTYFRDRLN